MKKLNTFIVFLLNFICVSAQTTQVFISGKQDTAFVKFKQLGDTSKIDIQLSRFNKVANKRIVIPYIISILNKGSLEKPKFVYIGNDLNGKTYHQYAKPFSYYNQKIRSTKVFAKLAVEWLSAFSYNGQEKFNCFTGYKLSKSNMYQVLEFTLVPKVGLLDLRITDGGEVEVGNDFRTIFKLNSINNINPKLYLVQNCKPLSK
jgi:hypothetical protein